MNEAPLTTTPAPSTTVASSPARPAVAPPEPWSFPVPDVFELGNGISGRVFDTPGQHVVSVVVAIPAPFGAEPRHLEGVGAIMSRTLDEGTLQHATEEFAELLERQGGVLSAGISERGIIVDLEVPVRRLEPALGLLREALLEPAFDESVVRRQVRTRLAEIDQERAYPSHRAWNEFTRWYYPSDSRWSRPAYGGSETVAAITAADVRAYHETAVRPDEATVVVAGHLGGLDVPGLIGDALGSWVATGRRIETPATPPPPDATRLVVVDRPGSVQTEIYVGCRGPHRTVDGPGGGWPPYPVLAYLIGGASQARIDTVLREEKGYTYGLRSVFRPRVGHGLFLTSGAVRTEVTGDALRLLLGILETARDGFTAEETTAGVDFIAKTAPNRYATADAIADEATGRALEGLGTADTTRVLQATAVLTPSDLALAYRAYVDGTWTVVLVGDAASIVPQVESLGRGDVSVVPA